MHKEPSISAATQDALATLEWVTWAENLAVAGPSGTGKSHFVRARTRAAIEKDLKVAWFTLESLATAIARAKGRRISSPDGDPDLPQRPDLY